MIVSLYVSTGSHFIFTRLELKGIKGGGKKQDSREHLAKSQS